MRISLRGRQLTPIQSKLLDTIAKSGGVPFLELATLYPESDAEVAEAIRGLKEAGLVMVFNEGDELRQFVTPNIDALASQST